MILAINLTISAILVVLSIFKRNSKFLFVLIFLWMWFLFSFNYGNADYTMYADLYDGISERTIEPGLNLLMDISNSFGLSYHAFLALLGAIGLSLTAVTILKRSKNNISLIAALYLVFPFVFDAIQIRNFIAMSLIIFGINFLIDRGRWWYLKYIIINLIAVSFHSMSAICLLFPVLVLVKRETVWIATTIMILLGTAISFNQSFFTSILSVFFDQEKVNAYFGLEGRYSNPGLFNIVLSVVILVSLLFIAYYCKKQAKNNEDKKISNCVSLVEKISIISLVLIPFLRYSTVLMRLTRSIMLLYYILSVGMLFINKKNAKRHNDKKEFEDTVPKNIARKKLHFMKLKRYAIIGQIVLVIFVWNYSFIFGIRNEELTYGAVFGNNIVEEKILGVEE